MTAPESGYGKIRVLHGIDMTITAGEVVALRGPNCADKTTLLRAVASQRAGPVRRPAHDQCHRAMPRAPG
ncbi:MAG: ATP-binding cassette domain-containing protein [Xanthobacteraceae bacterium]